MRLGFSGSRYGMTGPQHVSVFGMLASFVPTMREFVHGDCVGADREAHDEARILGYWIVIHPPLDNTYRAHCSGDVIAPPMEYLARNQAIVDMADALIAAPDSAIESMRSGTWATIRRAKKKGIPIFAFGPDGKRLDV